MGEDTWFDINDSPVAALNLCLIFKTCYVVVTMWKETELVSMTLLSVSLLTQDIIMSAYPLSLAIRSKVRYTAKNGNTDTLNNLCPMRL